MSNDHILHFGIYDNFEIIIKNIRCKTLDTKTQKVTMVHLIFVRNYSEVKTD